MPKNVWPFMIGVGLLLLAFQAAAAAGLEIPKLQARVTDLAGLLTREEISGLEEKLKGFEASDSTQIAVLIIPSLEGEVLEDFSGRVAEAWRLGQKGRDNGVLLFIAMRERQVRIEVGYGLEANLTDARSRRIIENEIIPNFRSQQYFQGVEAGVEAIIQTVRGVYQPVNQPPAESGRQRNPGTWFNLLIFLLAPLLWVLGSTGKWGGGILGGGAGAFLMYSLAGPALLAILAGGAAGAVLGAILGGLVKAGGRSTGHGRRGGFGGPFFPGGFGGGGFGGGGFGGGGGGFSGGGGGFGGGGASGRW
jgi:uncharacterized protein